VKSMAGLGPWLAAALLFLALLLPMQAGAQAAASGSDQAAAAGAAQGAAQGSAVSPAPGAGPANTPPGAQGTALPTIVTEKGENAFSRLEIVSFGSFPIMLFYTGFAFDLQRFFANGFDSAYAPWPFQSSYSAPLSDSDRITRLGVALGASLIVGGIDAYFHAEKVKKARRLHEAALPPPAAVGAEPTSPAPASAEPTSPAPASGP
jgi:hypothetical protein